MQLVGVAHPSPAKAAEFRRIDLVAGKAGIRAAAEAVARHFVYLSVAQPAPMMKAYLAVRAECEAEICDDSAPLVRARSGAPLALFAPTVLPVDGGAPCHSGRGSAPWVGHA